MAQAPIPLTTEVLKAHTRVNEDHYFPTATCTTDTDMEIDGIDFAVSDDSDQLSVLSDSSYQR